MQLARSWKAAIFEDCAPSRSADLEEELDKFPLDWREAVSSFCVLRERLREVLAASNGPADSNTRETYDLKANEVLRMFQREIARPEEFFRFKCEQIRDKIAFLTSTFTRIEARGELTQQVEGVLVANLAGILSQLDLGKDFVRLHRTRFQELLKLSETNPEFHKMLPTIETSWKYMLDAPFLESSFEKCQELLKTLHADVALDEEGRVIIRHESLIRPLYNGVPSQTNSSLPNGWEILIWLSMFLFCYGTVLLALCIILWEPSYLTAYVINSAIFLSLIALIHRKQVQLEISPLRTSVSALHLAVLRFLPPFRFFSRVWGKAHSVPLPYIIRMPLLKIYALAFNCNTSEMLYPLDHYHNLGEFFTRPLRPECRPTSQVGIASPVDAVVVSCHEVIDGVLEQVKGVTYPLEMFLGEGLSIAGAGPLYQITLYLSPGMYHRIHSPIDWTVLGRRHFPGTLFPVNKLFQRYMKGLFALNERVVLNGVDSQQRFFSLSAVGAYNVGSVHLVFDNEVQCNQSAPRSIRSGDGARLQRSYGAGIVAKRGDEIGRFNLGSTVVLVFSASESFRFTCTRGDRIKMGQCIGQE